MSPYGRHQHMEVLGGPAKASASIFSFRATGGTSRSKAVLRVSRLRLTRESPQLCRFGFHFRVSWYCLSMQEKWYNFFKIRQVSPYLLSQARPLVADAV